MILSYSINEIEKVASKLWENYKHQKVWAFYAPMGAGKTTFIHALCNNLKITDAVSSPTFSIIREYHSPIENTIYHMDLYRIKNEDEALQAGVEDCILSGQPCFIEWPELAENLLPKNCFKMTIEIVDELNRIIKIRE